MPFDLDITESLSYKMGEASAGARFLTRHLERHFGPLPDAIHQRIADASNEQLEHWDVLEPTANTLDDVFADRPE